MPKFEGTYSDLQGVPHLERAWGLLSQASRSPRLNAIHGLVCASVIARNHMEFLRSGFGVRSSGRQTMPLEAQKIASWIYEFSLIRNKAFILIQKYIPFFWDEVEDGRQDQVKITFRHSASSIIDHVGLSLLKFSEEFGIEIGEVLLESDRSALLSIALHRLRCASWLEHCNDQILHGSAQAATLTGEIAGTFDESVMDALSKLTVFPFPCDVQVLNQFRCMHQIPEIIALAVNDILRVEEQGLHIDELRKRVDICGDLIEYIFHCIDAIHRNLTPADYHSIRDFLGVTSGSHSMAISHKMLRKNIDAVILCAQSFCAAEATESARELQSSTRRLFALSIIWRDLHVSYPALYLGTGGTRSLIGAADALTATLRMRNMAVQRNVAKMGWGSIVTMDVPLFERQVQTVLTEYTQRRFQDVQDRTGFYKNRGDKP